MLDNPNITKIRRYSIEKNGKIILDTTNEKEAKKLLEGYTEVPPYGDDRAKHRKLFDQSSDRLEYTSYGNYASMITYVLKYYRK